MTQSKLTREIAKRTLDRDRWAGLNRQSVDLLVKGRGEGDVEVFFGKGFASPPTFNYSAITAVEESEILSFVNVPPRGASDRQLDSYGLPNDSMSVNGLIQDPSFESQGKYRAFSGSPWFLDWGVVPDAYEAFVAWYDYGWLPLADWWNLTGRFLTNEVSYKFGWSPQNGWGPHRWLQSSEVRERWSLTDSAFHDLGVGNAGKVSAQSTVGSGGLTNWLIPFDYSPGFQPTGYGSVTEPANYWAIWSTCYEPNPPNMPTSLGGGISSNAVPPPHLRGFKGFAYVKCDSDVELQVNATCLHQDYGSDSSSTFGEPLEPDFDYSVRVIDSVDTKVKVVGGGWRRVEIDLAHQGPTSWPTANLCALQKGLPRSVWWVLRLRVKGAPGATVYLDNVYIDRDMRNTEVPIMTIGVKEWIRDDSGVYIGAKLWVVRGGEETYCVRT